MTNTELRDALLTLISTEIGTYTLGANVTPAIAILAPRDTLPNDRKVNGLEVIIVASPVRYDPEYGYGITNQRKTWQVFLSQYQGSYTIDSALLKINTRFVGVKSNGVSATENQNIRSQYSVRIPDVLEVSDFVG